MIIISTANGIMLISYCMTRGLLNIITECLWMGLFCMRFAVSKY